MRPTKAIAATASMSLTDADEAAGGHLDDLPHHLTEKIIYHISPLASARLAPVCKSWASTVSSRLKMPVPHLFVYLPATGNTSDRRGVVVSVPIDSGGDDPSPAAEVIPNRVLMKNTNGLGCIGALPASGRLVFGNWCWSELVVLVNPITGACQSVDVGNLRSDPLLVAGGGDDSFVSFADGLDELVLWCRRRAAGGEEEEWSRQTVAVSWQLHRAAAYHAIVSVVSCNGCFYVLDRDGYVFSIDTATSAPPPLRLEKLPVASLFDHIAAGDVHETAAHGHLLECDGEVLLVRRVLDRGVAFCCHHDDATADLLTVVGFQVYRLDVTGGRWTEVRKLGGDMAIFVSAGSSFAVRSSETEGCRGNCIYFVDKKYCSVCNRDDGNAWGVYSMEEGEVLFKHAVTKQGPCSSATWFLPRV
ncbi:hypothetical protein HU200_022942 [Digitaria exilis]|uniref:KIB1-4 beta-propeller domain-containing protein n=1 Tax=Digitaria exilis TaxID=1010633 RepID=A0A835EUX8_9POAL|nr:hypothetical protein HU200_022942 [Digitaria exilis]